MLNVNSSDRKLLRNDSLSRNILLVEDEADTAQAIFTPLCAQGYLVRLVESKERALEAARHTFYHIVLLEYFMHGLQAEDFLLELQQISPKSCVVLLAEAYFAEEKCTELGLQHWIGKPISIQDVNNVLAKI